jgi:hypothetical protein
VKFIFERDLAPKLKSKAFKTKPSQILWFENICVDRKAKLLFFKSEIVTLLKRGWVFKLFRKELLKSNQVEKGIKTVFLKQENF